MTQNRIIEDRHPAQLRVVLSSKIRNSIDTIYAYNDNKISELHEWFESIETLLTHLSYPSIAFDYAHRCTYFPNGALSLNAFGFTVGYVIKTNKSNSRLYVYVFRLSLNASQYGLVDPLNLKTTSIKMSESQLRNIISEAVHRAIRQVLNEKFLFEHRLIERRRPNRVRNL